MTPKAFGFVFSNLRGLRGNRRMGIYFQGFVKIWSNVVTVVTEKLWHIFYLLEGFANF